VSDEFGSGFVEHAGLLVGAEGVVREAVDAAFLDIFSKAPFVDDFAKVGATAGPVSLLNDATVHVDDHHGSIG